MGGRGKKHRRSLAERVWARPLRCTTCCARRAAERAEDVSLRNGSGPALTAHDFDIVLMGWNAPKMLGNDTARKIGAQGSRAHIIMATTEVEKAKVIDSLKADASD